MSDSECPACGPLTASAPTGKVAVGTLGAVVAPTAGMGLVPAERLPAFQMMTQIAHDLHAIKVVAVCYLVVTIAAVGALVAREIVSSSAI